ncbi:MAG: hypothetical protein LIO92_01520 [Clostridiales bacterium]|nr:hypothetical protein [Clostridiales bacterium]
MIRMLKRGAILFFIFVIALVGYIIWNRGKNTTDPSSYRAMEEASFPVVYAEMCGRRMNPMYGFRQDMGNVRVRDSLTVLPQDRGLMIDVVGSTGSVQAIRYEIRSLDLERLVENTELESWDTQDGEITARLPIQNLLTKDNEYLLRLELEIGGESVYYYTRIVWTDDTAIESMIDLAVNFSARTFSYDEARELVTYLETNDTEDNSSFGTTTIRSSFSQLTWGRLKMQPAGEVQVSLRERHGRASSVTLSYMASRTTDSGRTETYEVEENFTMKWNEIRTYMMDYERKVNQVVTGEQEDFSGKRLMLGISNDDEISVTKSPDGQVLAFRANRDLWCYQQRERRAVRIFSFRSEQDDPRSDHREHDIRILRVEDNGDMNFLVYGYHNRGSHEGEFGIAGYLYDESSNSLTELFFIPVNCRFEKLKMDMDTLSYQSENDMLYLYLDHAVFGIDCTSNETMVLADALQDGSFAASLDQSRIAWQEGGPYDAHILHLLDLETGERMDITGGAEDEFVRVLGFVGNDLVYGLARADALWTENGRTIDLPMYAVEIINDEMQVETHYEKEGYYVAGVEVDESRIHLRRVTRGYGTGYTEAQEDTIVCNMDVGAGNMDGIGWYASQDKGKVYFVQLDQEISVNRSIRVISPGRLVSGESDRLELASVYELAGLYFYAYGNGRLIAVTTDFSKALSQAYERMGFVTDQNENVLWDRVDRPDAASVSNVDAAVALMERHLDGFTESRSFSDGVVLLDARECSLQQLLYFIGKGMPVLGYTQEGAYVVLSGYDPYNVTVYQSSGGTSFKAGINDSTEYFRRLGNDFICAVQLP